MTRFVLHVPLGRLAADLRMLGFDALYCSDEELSRIAVTDPRILLTRDVGLLMRSAVTYGYYIRESHARRQLVEVLCRFDVLDSIRPLRAVPALQRPAGAGPEGDRSEAPPRQDPGA